MKEVVKKYEMKAVYRQLNVRLPAELYDWVVETKKREGIKSLAKIVAIMIRAFRDQYNKSKDCSGE